MQRLFVREVRCKSVLHAMDKTGDYTANLYRGCSHGCVYCYAPSLIHDERRWGSFVDVKVNGPQVLARELRRVRRGIVFLSSASDPYQPIEARYGLTRRTLEMLRFGRFPAVILTRSPMVLRDLDILKQMDWVRVGFSISSVTLRRLEPGVAPIKRRVQALRALRGAGVKTWVSLAPVVPGLRGVDIAALLDELKEAGVATVSEGMLRFQGYERSQKLFEEVAGTTAKEAMKGEAVTHTVVREMIGARGFETREGFFDWREERSIDEYLRVDRVVP